MARKNRSIWIDPKVATDGFFHVMSRCTRGLFLLDDGGAPDSSAPSEGVDAKQWSLDRLALLTSVFGIRVVGFSIMSNHFHLAIEVDAEQVAGWSAAEVTRRWLKLHSGRSYRNLLPDQQKKHVAELAGDVDWVAQQRAKLGSVSQFMKDFKQSFAQWYNHTRHETGAVWQGRFKLTKPKDEVGKVAVLAYIDANPCAAGLVSDPEAGEHTSLEARLDGRRRSEAAKRRVVGVRRWLSPVVWAGHADACAQGALRAGKGVLRVCLSFADYRAYLKRVAGVVEDHRGKSGELTRGAWDRLREDVAEVLGLEAGLEPGLAG